MVEATWLLRPLLHQPHNQTCQRLNWWGIPFLHFFNFQRQASADFDAMKANMDQFFLIVNGSIIILMQVFVHNLNGKVELFLPTTGWLCFSGGWICPEQKRDKHSDQELCRPLFW